jgi:hypothetical protein
VKTWPEQNRTKVRLKGISLVGELPVNCEIESRWISGWQRYSKTADGVLIETFEIIKKNLYSIAVRPLASK